MKYNISNMMSLDIYLDSLQDCEYKKIISETPSADQSVTKCRHIHTSDMEVYTFGYR